MGTKYFKKVEGIHTCYAATMPEHKGIRIMVGNGCAMVDNLYCHTPGDYKEISEEEFTEAFDSAMSELHRNLLIAA